MSQPEHSQPPPYNEAIGKVAPTLPRREKNGITPTTRRSMEDEHRPLPEGWVRTYDPQTSHQFFVDTKADPPRSIWHHPLDDEQFLATLAPSERERFGGIHRHPSAADLEAESTDEEESADEGKSMGARGSGYGYSGASEGVLGLGRKVKDALTGTTHQERMQRRKTREQEERNMLEQHRIFRRALEEALRTRKPAFLGQDDSGNDVFLEPPGVRYPGVRDQKILSDRAVEVFYSSGQGPQVQNMGGRGVRFIRADGVDYDGMGGRGLGGMYSGSYGGYQRPYGPYRRPYGYGYGGGMGLPLMAPLFGGMMLGGLLF
ncbi:hypothetical protein F4778DRAFT_795836 [Xylariomycetidae sp. FL2044]|nr:hypothetical protein F4778DRAFT_795836 [Xylariomycetidae sp. FL2044]